MNKIILILISVFCFLQAQEYEVTIWGLPIGTAELQQISDNEISYKLKSNEFIDYIYPIDLEYYSKFSKTNYSIIINKKNIEQGTEEQKYEAVLNEGNVFVYNKKDSINLEQNTHSLLSLLVKVMNSPIDSIDTKWYNLENEGSLYETRFLWNDSTTVSVDNKNVMCDHYRLDLKLLDDNDKIFEKTDYFNELFFDINSIRQIWVEKWQKQQRIIRITIKNNLINLSLMIKS